VDRSLSFDVGRTGFWGATDVFMAEVEYRHASSMVMRRFVYARFLQQGMSESVCLAGAGLPRSIEMLDPSLSPRRQHLHHLRGMLFKLNQLVGGQGGLSRSAGMARKPVRMPEVE